VHAAIADSVSSHIVAGARIACLVEGGRAVCRSARQPSPLRTRPRAKSGA